MNDAKCTTKEKLKVNLSQHISPRSNTEGEEKPTGETSACPNGIWQVGHFLARLESRSATHSLQKRCEQRLMMTDLKRRLHVEHLSIFYRIIVVSAYAREGGERRTDKSSL